MILREMAESLKRISDRQEDIYAAIIPLIKLVGGINKRQAFDKTVLNGLMNLAKFDLDCLEDESKVKFAEGNIHLLKKQGKINSDIQDYFVARDVLGDTGSRNLESKVQEAVSTSTTGILQSVRQECISTISKMNVAMNDMMTKRGKELNKSVSSIKQDVISAQTSIDSATKEAKDLVLAMAKKEIAEIKLHREDDVSMCITKMDKAIASLAIKIDEVKTLEVLVENKINKYKFMRDIFDKRLSNIMSSAEEKIKDEEMRMQKEIDNAIKTSKDKFEKYQKELVSVSDSLDVTFDAEVRPELNEITKKLTDKLDALEEAKKEVDAIASSMSTTIMSAERTVAQVGNFIPKRERKVFINGKRNN